MKFIFSFVLSAFLASHVTLAGEKKVLNLKDSSGNVSFSVSYEVDSIQGNKSFAYHLDISEFKIENIKGTPLIGGRVEFIATPTGNIYNEVNVRAYEFTSGCVYTYRCQLAEDLFSMDVYYHEYLQEPVTYEVFVRVTLPNGGKLDDPYREDDKFKLMFELP